MKDKKFIYDGKSRPSTDLYKENFNRIFNPTLTKNMPNVKWQAIPPVRGPNPQGIVRSKNGKKNSIKSKKLDK
jgi:hypothetical protein|tara:strand:- start:158 stop:376 length:219 start_codon:yes stop_codon:yes gene_type:complete